SSTFKTTIPLGNCPIVPLSISNISVVSTSAVTGKVPYLVTFVTFLSTRAIVMKMALGALGQRSTIRLLFTCPHIVTYRTEAVIRAEIGMPTIRTAEVDLVQNNRALEINLDLLEERREEAAIREAKSKAKIEKYYNAKV
ncbi:hypothetical protein Tco_1295757, partial [Tanacetum coccineum]